MEKLEEPKIDFPIERINRFLENHIFEVPMHYDLLKDIKLPVKVKLTGMKNFISVGEWRPYIVYELHIVPGNKTQNFMASIYFGKENVTEIPFEVNLKDRGIDSLIHNLSELLRNFLQYWGVNYRVNCGEAFSHVPFNIDTKNLTESLIIESKYDGIVRKLVKDVISVVKYEQTGEFSLPEDIDEVEMVYDFPQLDTDFSVELNIVEDESINDYIIDAEYYEDDDTIVIGITLNPTKRKSLLQKMIGDLNETLMHEITHIKQLEKGLETDDTSKMKPLEYYTQEHELEAQYRGFKRRAKSEKRTIQDVMDEWFNKNKKLHRLKPKEVEIVKNKVLGYSS
jgi:hypothetical protein